MTKVHAFISLYIQNLIMFNNFISDREVTKDWHEMITLYNLHEEYLLWLIT